MRMLMLICSSPLCLIASSAAAVPPLADKSEYHLFHPVPSNLLREMSTDRPDTTESPFTVDAGHVQLEMSFVDFVKDGGGQTWTFAPLNLKLGVLNNIDVQFVFDPYVMQRGGAADVEGRGDLQLRAKINLWGNDPAPGQNTALAIMPFITLPTAADGIGADEIEGGLIVPLAVDLGDGWDLGLMAELDAVRDELDSQYDLEFLHTASIGRDLTDSLGAYVEYIGTARTDSENDYSVAMGGGLTFALTPDVQLDCGVNIGLAGGADDLNLFTGMTVRF